MFTIVDLHPDDEQRVTQTAQVVVDAFRDCSDTWPDLDSAIDEVRESFGEDRLSVVAVDEAVNVVGWIGAIREYDGHAWELHPLAVRPDWQRRGVGRALVAGLEARVRERGGTTIYLGTDDTEGRTSLAGVDLYANLPELLTSIQNLDNHPFSFYQRCGYTIVGVIPDANGPGKPDILMARRVSA